MTEASYLIERLVQNAAYELEHRPGRAPDAELHPPDQFPYKSATGFVYDSGDYQQALELALEKIGYDELRREQAGGAQARAS